MSPHNNGVWVFLLTLTCALHLLRGPVPRAAEVAGPPEWLSHRSLLASPAANNCYSTIDWGALPADPKTGVSAVFSPYNIVFGGGERYLLMAVAVLQQMGYAVHVLILEDNSCQTVAQLMEVAQGLRVPIDPAKVELHHVTLSENAIMVSSSRVCTAEFTVHKQYKPSMCTPTSAIYTLTHPGLPQGPATPKNCWCCHCRVRQRATRLSSCWAMRSTRNLVGWGRSTFTCASSPLVRDRGGCREHQPVQACRMPGGTATSCGATIWNWDNQPQLRLLSVNAHLLVPPNACRSGPVYQGHPPGNLCLL